jgi:hypothetical protein
MSKPAPTRYRTLNWSSYNAALRERGSLTVWFDPSTPWHAAPSGKRGAQPVYGGEKDQETVRWTVSPTNAIQACLTVKGEGRLGNGPGDRSSPERAKPRDGSTCRSVRRQVSS